MRSEAPGRSLPARGGKPRNTPATAAAIATGSSPECCAETEEAKDCGAAGTTRGRKQWESRRIEPLSACVELSLCPLPSRLPDLASCLLATARGTKESFQSFQSFQFKASKVTPRTHNSRSFARFIFHRTPEKLALN